MASIFFSQRWERDNLCGNRSSVPNSHVKPVKIHSIREAFLKTTFSGSIPGLMCLMVLQVVMAIISDFFLFFSLRHQYCLLCLTKHHFRWNHGQKHHVRCRGKEKVNPVNEMQRHEWKWVRKCYKNRKLCVACLPLATFGSTTFG